MSVHQTTIQNIVRHAWFEVVHSGSHCIRTSSYCIRTSSYCIPTAFVLVRKYSHCIRSEFVLLSHCIRTDSYNVPRAFVENFSWVCESTRIIATFQYSLSYCIRGHSRSLVAKVWGVGLKENGRNYTNLTLKCIAMFFGTNCISHPPSFM